MMTTTRFDFCVHAEKTIKHGIFCAQRAPRSVGGKNHQTRFFRHAKNNAEETSNHGFFRSPKGGQKKPSYYVREEKVLQVALFPSSHSSTKSQRTSTPASRKLTAMDRISLTLPYPPSVNHYWQTRVLRRGDRYVPQVYVSADGLRYQQAVAKHLDGVPRFKGRLRVQILVQPPDGRARDLDNVLKCLLDSLTKAGVWNDDQQIDSLLVVRGDQTPGGKVIVIVEECAYHSADA